jgi:hypothetical protein
MAAASDRAMRASSIKSGRREYFATLRREVAKHGREIDLAEFECLFLCMDCGHLSEPRSGDPMRFDAQVGPRNCARCGAVGLLDLRQTSIVHSLSELEATDVRSSWAARAGKIFGVLGITAASGWLFVAELGFLGVPVAALGVMQLARFGSSLFGDFRSRRSRPRRWRMPQTSTRPGAAPHEGVRGRVDAAGELLRAPLSGRPCVAYEVAVRDDDDPTGPLSSWRLIDQDNAGFQLGEFEVSPGEALLQLERELNGHGIIGGKDPATRRYMRMRGLLDGEEVFIYETILAPGDSCELSRRKADAPVLVRR